MLRVVLGLIWVVAAAAASAAGWDYYVTPLQERPFTEGHALFASSALVGHGYGVAGAAFMVLGVVTYSARRRWRALAKLGKLKHWLQVHIFLCTLGPFLVLLHSTFRVGGIVAIAFWSMALVVGSGVFGRYLYVRIPKTLQGRFLSLESVEERRAEAFAALEEALLLEGKAVERLAGLIRPQRPTNLAHALVLGIRWDWDRRRRERAIRGVLLGPDASDPLRAEAVDLAIEETRLGGQVALIEPFRRLFRYWHVFHLPLAIVMFLVLAVHVTVAVLFGYSWVL